MSDVKAEIKLCEQTLRRIDADREPLQAQLEKLNEEQHETELRICQLKYGLSIGCTVEQGGRHYRVTAIRVHFDPPWLVGVKKLKTGSWGTKNVHIFGNWKVVSS